MKKTIASLQRQRDRFRADNRKITNSLTYQAGCIVARAYDKPFPEALRLPGRLLSVARRQRQAVRNDRMMPAGPPPAVLKGGRITDAAVVTSRLNRWWVRWRLGDRRCAREMIRAGRWLEASGQRGAELALARNAAALVKDGATLHALFYAAHKSGDLSIAGDACRQLSAYVEKTLDPREKSKLAKIQSAFTKSRVDDLLHRARYSDLPPTPRHRRIAYVLHNALPYSSGGYATRAHGLAKALQGGGFDIQLITRPGFPKDMKPDFDSVPDLIQIEGLCYRHDILYPGRHEFDYYMAAADALEAVLREMRPAIVMAASNHFTSIPALIAARRLKVPFIYEVRGFWEITRVSRQPAFLNTSQYKRMVYYETLVAKNAEEVFTLTEGMRAELVRRGVDSKKITLAPNACNVDRFQPQRRDCALAKELDIPDDVSVIGYVGTFVQYEGLDDLAEACARLKAAGHTFRLLLVGNEDATGHGRGAISEKIEAIATHHGFQDWLIMPGRVPHERVAAYYSLIDIAPFPRKPQPVTEIVSPMKPLEAMAMSKAVVVSSVHALEEMVHPGETGEVFTKGNIDDLAAVLERLIDDPQRCARLGQAARAWVAAERTWDRVAETVAARLHALMPEVHHVTA